MLKEYSKSSGQLIYRLWILNTNGILKSVFLEFPRKWREKVVLFYAANFLNNIEFEYFDLMNAEKIIIKALEMFTGLDITIYNTIYSIYHIYVETQYFDSWIYNLVSFIRFVLLIPIRFESLIQYKIVILWVLFLKSYIIVNSKIGI